MPSQNSEIYNQIINAVDIVDVIGEKVKLRPTSRGFMGLCPFHDEKTPSFHVYTDTQSYYCFGCHKAGNIFNFVMDSENLEFKDALRILADRAGIKLPEYGRNKNSISISEILEISAKFFTDNLKGIQGTVARAYMKRRILDESDIQRFSLGLSLNSWDSLTSFLRRSGISDRDIIESGLAIQNKNGLYDRFRGRLMFPIKDMAGKTNAFGGRLIDGEGAKYLNSPESKIYSKRRNLYMLDTARKYIREKKRSILVEGYMDAIRLHKCGFNESVASLGTSLTPEQAELLAKFADRCYVCYDSDNAGINAAVRGMFILQEHGLDVYVVNIPDGKDPDEFLISNPPEKFEEIITNARPLILQYIEILKPSLSDPLTRKNAMKNLFEGLSRLGIDELMRWRSQLSEATLIPPSRLEKIFLSGKRNFYVSESQNQNSIDKKSRHNLEAALCSMLFHNPECRFNFDAEEAMKIINDPVALDTALSLLNENPERLQFAWISMGENEKISLIAEGDIICSQLTELSESEKWKKISGDLRLKAREKRVIELTEKMKNNTATQNDLMELMRLKNFDLVS